MANLEACGAVDHKRVTLVMPEQALCRDQRELGVQELGVQAAVICGGGSLAPHLDDFFEALGLPVLNGWGLSETSPVLACRRIDAPDAPERNVRGTVGGPIPGTRLKYAPPPLPPFRPGLPAARASPPKYRILCRLRGPTHASKPADLHNSGFPPSVTASHGCARLRRLWRRKRSALPCVACDACYDWHSGCRLVDPDCLEREVADGVTGVVLARGPGVMQRYWNDPEATAAAFVGSYFNTGDPPPFPVMLCCNAGRMAPCARTPEPNSLSRGYARSVD